MVQKTSKGTERNPAFREYYEKKLGEGKNGQQALICISRRLINIFYGILKNGTEYRMPKPRNCDEKKLEIVFADDYCSDNWFIDLANLKQMISELYWHASEGAVDTNSFSLDDLYFATI